MDAGQVKKQQSLFMSQFRNRIRFTGISILLVLLSSCGSAKRNRVVVKKQRSTSSEVIRSKEVSRPIEANTTAASIVDFAMGFEGTRYKYGGTTKKGMDCSGLIYRSFGEHNISMPRTTTDLASRGDWVDVKEVVPGDLVFFATRKNSRKINHVGIVTDISRDDFSFIHASTSRGVMVSKLSDRYWYFAYVQARRVL